MPCRASIKHSPRVGQGGHMYKEIANIINEILGNSKYVTLFTDYRDQLHISRGAVSPFTRFGQIIVPWDNNDRRLLEKIRKEGIYVLRIRAQSGVLILGKAPFNAECINAHEIRNL